MYTWSTKIISFNLLFSFILSFSQEDKIKNQYYIFLDAKTQDIKIIKNDSIIYTNGFNKKQKLIKGDFPENLSFYEYQYSINQKNYFVNSGGGVVLEYSDGHLKRIDHSFLHKNQFHASHFQYNNEMYLFGGYGLFTYKNILTKFDFSTKEWFLVGNKSKEKPFPGTDQYHILIGNHFYLFGGYREDEISFGPKPNNPNKLWKYNLKNYTWESIGIVNLKYNIPFYNGLGKNNFIADQKIYITDFGYSAIVDILNNKITYYKTKIPINNEKIIYNPKNKTLNYLTVKTATRQVEFTSIPLKDFFQNPIEVDKFYTNPIFYYSNWIYGGVFISFLSIVFWLKIKTKKKKKTRHKSITTEKKSIILYDPENDLFHYNGSIIENLSSLEQSLLSYLMNNLENYILIHNLNGIIEKSINSQSINTVLRKREATLNSLKTKISLILDVDYDDVILEQKNQQDKRIKEIKLNNQFFKFITDKSE